MHLKRFSVLVTIRITLLLLTMVGLAAIFGRADLFFNQIILGILISIQGVGLIRYVRKTNHDLAKFLLAIKNADFTVHFGQEPDRSFQSLHAAFKELLGSYQQLSAEREVQYQYLQLLVSRINVGIISLRGSDHIALMNQAALSLLQTDLYHHWHNLERKYPQFVQAVDALGEGESKLLELKVAEETKRLSVQVRSAILRQESYRIITLHDIEQEINQSEIDAYHRLIRTLTHEIMNSITPIASLSETLLMLLKDQHGHLKPWSAVGENYLEDLARSLHTISRRSDGLLRFVEDYRRLAKLPQPQPEVVVVTDLLRTIEQLMQAELRRQNITLTIRTQPEVTTVWGDPHLIEQVLINLVTNSIHAVEATTDPHIILACYAEQEQTVIEVTDNGAGIDPDKLDQIFIPFFSTKAQGSGIGLSLSRHIMTLHHGSIRVQSSPGRTTFLLHFRKTTHSALAENLT